MKRILMVLVVLGFVVGITATSALAVSYPSLPPASYPVAGESLLSDTGFNNYVDWAVYNPLSSSDLPAAVWNDIGSVALGNYVYLYQLEHPTVNGSQVAVDEFFLLGLPTATILSDGWIDGYDLDDVHNSANFSNLASEHEEGTTLEDVYFSGVIGTAMGWQFENLGGGDNGVVIGNETETMWFVSNMYPTYVTGRSRYTFDQNVPTFGQVPGPAPEPSSMTLLGIGLLGALGSRFKRRRKGRKMGKFLVLVGIACLVFGMAGIKAGYADSIVLQDGLNSYTGTRDTYINEQSQDTNYGSQTNLLIRNSSLSYDRVSLISFDLSSLSSLSISSIDSAYLGLYRTTGSDNVSIAHTIGAYRITEGVWYEDNADWDRRRDTSSDLYWDGGGNFGSSDYTTTGSASTSVGTAQQYYDWNVTNIVNGWWAGTYDNYGFALLSPNYTSIDGGVFTGYLYFYSSEYNPAASNPLLYRPKLTINYTPTGGDGGDGEAPAEPASMVLLGIGLLGAIGSRVRRKR